MLATEVVQRYKSSGANTKKFIFNGFIGLKDGDLPKIEFSQLCDYGDHVEDEIKWSKGRTRTTRYQCGFVPDETIANAGCTRCKSPHNGQHEIRYNFGSWLRPNWRAVFRGG